ncbi:hypothetical protein ILYODFUR_010951, partial [Ilyodon furcidens]
PELTSQVSASLVLFSHAAGECHRRGSPPGNGHTRVLLPGTSHSGIRSSVPLPPKAGWLAKPTRRVLASLTLRATAAPPPTLYFFRLVNDGFCGATEADYSRCVLLGVKPAEKYWFLPPLSRRRTARAS